jgi:hypothetical protein
VREALASLTPPPGSDAAIKRTAFVHRLAIAEVELYAPCKILEYIQLWDVPGTCALREPSSPL